MTVSHIAYSGKVEVIHPKWVPPVFADEVTAAADRGGRDCLESLLFGATNCSNAVFDHADIVHNPHKSIDEFEICGDASEAGILRFTERIQQTTTTAEIRTRNPLVACLPFNSNNKYMATVHRQEGSSPDFLRVAMKGAPESVVDHCTRICSSEAPGGERGITRYDIDLIEKQIAYLASRGERVLAFAQLDMSPQQSARLLASGDDIDLDNIPTTDMCFVGLLSLVDPPRPSVPNAVKLCQTAGVKVFMVTGDHPATALSIAKQVGIITQYVTGDEDTLTDSPGNALVIHGSEISSFTEEDWARVLGHDQLVFARTSPHQKLTIVQELQKMGHIVSVTGDGVNDAPALKMANTGVAMGISGSEVSKEAADIVLLDDNFASIVNGVEEGRLIFDNLKKSISYTLTSNVPQLVPFLLFLVFQIPLPLTTVLILVIDLGTDIFPAISLAYEDPEWDLMKRPPRNRKRNRLLNARLLSFSMLQLGIIQSYGGFFAYFVVFNDRGLSPSTLLRLDRQGRFGTERLTDQRWLYTAQTRPDGFAFEAAWFASDTKELFPFFSNAGRPAGTILQTEEQFSMVIASEKGNVTGIGSVPVNTQFNNMIKSIALATGRQPCLAYACELDAGGVTRNNVACLESTNSKQLYLTGILDGTVNDKIQPGKGIGQGCFDLWTPPQERGVARIAQTAFFVSVVVTKTRMLSVFQQGLSNSALVFSLGLELGIAIAIVYVPVFHRGLNVRTLRLVEWLPGLPFGIFIFAYDETRKHLIRRHLLRNDAIRDGLDFPPNLTDKIAFAAYKYTLW
jgi:soluble P-type ATPase